MVTGLGAADLANNIASATKGLASALGLANPDPKFPEFADQGITSKFQREHWYKTPSQGLYAFSVEQAGQGTVSEFPAFVDNIASLFGGAGGGDNFFNKDSFTEFKLPIAPQELSQTEDFAVSIKPTQGGTVVNHSGNKYKTLTISGTTGVHPFKGLLGAYKGNGVAIGKPDELKYRSGYEVFQHFRNWMKSYHETKAQPGKTNLRMLFRNYKDWEFLYVEPLKFTLKRDAAKPLLYNYFIQFRVIGVHTIEKPLFDLAISKLNDISVALINTYALIKTNKDVTESIAGTIEDFEASLNNLKMAIKASNKQPLKLSEFTTKDTKKLSFKETLQLLGVIGAAMVKSASDTKQSEANGSLSLSDDPVTKGTDLIYKSKNPSSTNASAAKAELNQLLASEPALLTGISLTDLPPALAGDLAKKQMEAALVSKVSVKDVQDQAKSITEKLSEGVGLGDSSYNAIFGITPTNNSAAQGQFTDAQFEMLYALSQVTNQIDGILSSDEMFDRNASLFKQSGATNGAGTIGKGIFSFPNPNGGVKEGFLPAGMSLEDIALAELGDASRWTEIAELNGLKAPYIVAHAGALKPNYPIQSQNYKDPSAIRQLAAGDVYLVPTNPVPTGAWLGKGNYLARFQGGDATSALCWQFIYPDDGMLVQIISTQQFLKFASVGSIWSEVDPSVFNTDGVLQPGDKIRIPSGAVPPSATAIQGPRDNRYTNTLSRAEKALGVDLRLNEDMDLDFTPAGDLNVAAGVENAAQAIVLKLLYEKGSLKKFPRIGTNLTPGKKLPDIAGIRTDVTTSLLQDNRIKDVVKINYIQVNGTTTLSFDVLFHDIQQPIPITIPV